jgi:hypothetical protein
LEANPGVANDKDDLVIALNYIVQAMMSPSLSLATPGFASKKMLMALLVTW